jgi:hypothetical protein
LGEKLVDERINIYTDPSHPELPSQQLGRRRPAAGKKDMDRKGRNKKPYLLALLGTEKKALSLFPTPAI